MCTALFRSSAVTSSSTSAAQALTVAELASRAGISERTLLGFTKATGFRPTEYLQHVRTAKASKLLEKTKRPIEQISWQVGYSDPAAFRKVFQRLTSLSPSLYRKRFSTGERHR